MLMIQATPPANLDQASIFQPELIMPSQLGRCGYEDTPELRLLAAVLEDAYVAVRRPKPKPPVYRKNRKGGRQRDEGQEALDWFETVDTTEFFSFVSICDRLGLDVDCWRAKARSLFRSGVSRKTRARNLAGRGHTRIRGGIAGGGSRVDWVNRSEATRREAQRRNHA